jgi:hypothetical protein
VINPSQPKPKAFLSLLREIITKFQTYFSIE